MDDRYEPLDYADRWFFDLLKTTEPPGFFIMEDIDMTITRQIMASMRQFGIKGTYTHIIVRAVALALARHPELHRLVLGKQLVYPGTVDIGMSVSSDLAMAGNPALILANAGEKNLMQIAQEIIGRADEVRAQFAADRARMRRAGRVLRLGWLRRMLFRNMRAKMPLVRKKMGTFHVTNISSLRFGVPFMYPAGAVLAITRVEDRVVARDGQPVVRPMVSLGMSGDHRVWDGNAAAVLIMEMKKILEEGELKAEVTDPALSIQAAAARIVG